MPNWKKVAVSGSAASFTSLSIDTSITASIVSSSQFIGNLSGTASYATSASYALTSSHVNPLQQDVSITGSFSVTGSTVQIGNNTLTGNTQLTGSIEISGSQTFLGTNTITGSVSITGSTIQIGNNTLLGNTLLSGSITISGSSLNPQYTSVDIYGNTDMTGYLRFFSQSVNIDNSVSASYIFMSGSTNDLYFAQNNKGYANSTRLRWIEGNLYTGLLNGGIITSQSSTVYQVGSGSGIIVNLNASLNDNPYPTIQYLNWGNLSASIAPLSASYDQSFVGIQSNGTIYAQGTPFYNGQFNTLINIGTVLHQNHSTINLVKTAPSVAYGAQQNNNVFIAAFGPLKLSGFTLAPSGSSTGSIVVGSGTSYLNGGNYTVDPNDPDFVTDAGSNVSKIWRYYDSGSDWVYDTNNGNGYATIDPTQYSLNGTLTAVPGTGANRQWSIQRAFWFPASVSKATVVYYGNKTYTSEADAIANIPYEPFVEAPNTAANAIYLGAIVVRNDANFTVAASYKIQPGGLFRQVGGSGGGGSVVTQTLTGLSDVAIAGPTNLQPFVYSTTAAKWINSSIISASVAGNATSATSASYALTASYVQDAISASYALSASYAPGSGTSVTASYALTASYVQDAISASYALSASYAPGSGTSVSASYATTSSYAISASYAPGSGTSETASYALTASSVATLNQDVTITGSLNIKGTVTADSASFVYLTTIYETSSVVYSSGSNTLGDASDDIQTLWGNVVLPSGPLVITGSASATSGFTSLLGGFTGSLLGIAAQAKTATSASYAISASYAPGSDASISSSYSLSSSYAISSSFAISASYAPGSGTSVTASYALTASFVQNAISSSYALTASYISGAFNSVTSSYAESASNFVISNTLTLTAALMRNATVNNSINGSNIVMSQVTGSYSSAFFQYTATSASNARAGQLTAVWNETTTTYTDFSTTDIGSTTAVTASVSLLANTLQFNVQTNTAGWKIKTLATYL